MRSIRDFKDNIGLVAGKNLLSSVDDVLQLGTKYNILTGIVKETISNPYEYLNRDFQVGSQTYSGIRVKDVLSGRVTVLNDGTEVTSPIKNNEHVDNMPMNSIFAQIVDNSRSIKREKMVICYPFFPPHMSLPLKAGEYVWMIQEDIKGVDYYYWMCRKVGAMQVDDINHTNLERTRIVAEMYDTFERSSQEFTPSTQTLEKMISLAKSETSNLSEASYADILKTSYGYVNEFIGEPVPRLAKNCGDLLLQGSNNAGIHLTTEKFNKDESTGELIASEVSDYLGNQINAERVDQPAIDIFVARKKDKEKSAQLTRSTRTNLSTSSDPNKIHVDKNLSDSDESLEFEEINKLRDLFDASDPRDLYSEELYETEPRDVGARIYMSNQLDVDYIFETPIKYGDDSEPTENSDGACIVTYADANRVVGGNVRIHASGPAYAHFGEDILIKTEGGSPSANTYLHLKPGQDGNAILSTKADVQINAGDTTGKIYLTNGDLPSKPSSTLMSGVTGEPYVLVSQLEKVLNTISQTLQVHASAITGLAPLRFPPFIAPAAQVVQQTLLNSAMMNTSIGLESATTAMSAPVSIALALNAEGKIRSNKIIASPEN